MIPLRLRQGALNGRARHRSGVAAPPVSPCWVDPKGTDFAKCRGATLRPPTCSSSRGAVVGKVKGETGRGAWEAGVDALRAGLALLVTRFRRRRWP